MSDLNEKARTLIRATQFVDEPSQADYDRVHAAVEARIALGIVAGAAVTVAAESAAASTAVTTAAAVGTVAAAASTTAASAPAVAGAAATVAGIGGVGAAAAPPATAVGAALFTKVAAWVVIAGAVAVGTTAVVQHEVRVSTQARAPIAVTRPASPDVAGVPVKGQAGALLASTPPSTTIERVEPPPAAADPVEHPVAAEPRATGPAAAQAPAPADTSGLDTEIALLRDARDALRGGQPDRALAVVEEHARRFPHGALAEEGDAERVLCLCALSRLGEARARAVLFAADYPHSSYQASLKSSCAVAEPSP
jgi:hypothetical protein